MENPNDKVRCIDCNNCIQLSVSYFGDLCNKCKIIGGTWEAESLESLYKFDCENYDPIENPANVDYKIK